MKYSINRIRKYKIKYNKRRIRVLDEFKSKNNLDLMYIEDYLRIYNEKRDKFTLKDLISKLEMICSIIGKNGHLYPEVSDECIEEKLSRHHNDKKYDIILAVDQRNITHYACKEEITKIERAGGKKRRKRLEDRYTYDNPLNRIHGFVIYDKNPGPPGILNMDKRVLSIEVIGSNPYASRNGFKGIGAMLLLYIIMLGKIHKFDKIILEIANEDAEIDDECDINDTGDNDSEDKAEARRILLNMTRKQLKKIARYYFLPLGGLKLHIINHILWHEYDAEWGEDDMILWGESDYESDYESNEESDEESDGESDDDWYYPEFEPLYMDIDVFKDWNYKGKDCAIYGYGGKRYLEGRKKTIDLYNWYVRHGFVENEYLNTRDKYFSMTPLPAMELVLNKHKLKKIAIVFLDNKYLC